MAEPVPLKIKKPSIQDRFRVTKPPSIAGVDTVLQPLPILKISEVNDYCRVHPDEECCWTGLLYFVSVPIVHDPKHAQLHIITEELADKYIQPKRRKVHRLALATKPYDVRFFCIVPTDNVENSWNKSALAGIELAKRQWVEVTSLKATGVDEYKVTCARDHDAFPEPKWALHSVDEYLDVTFAGLMIENDDHPGFCRLIGKKQTIA
jgi:hypothetical protein